MTEIKRDRRAKTESKGERGAMTVTELREEKGCDRE